MGCCDYAFTFDNPQYCDSDCFCESDADRLKRLEREVGELKAKLATPPPRPKTRGEKIVAGRILWTRDEVAAAIDKAIADERDEIAKYIEAGIGGGIGFYSGPLIVSHIKSRPA